MATRLAERGWVPEAIHSSDARRTRETAELLMEAFAPAPSLTFDPDLYLAGLPAPLRRGAGVGSVLVHRARARPQPRLAGRGLVALRQRPRDGHGQRGPARGPAGSARRLVRGAPRGVVAGGRATAGGSLSTAPPRTREADRRGAAAGFPPGALEGCPGPTHGAAPDADPGSLLRRHEARRDR